YAGRRRCHADDHQPFADAAQRLEDCGAPARPEMAAVLTDNSHWTMQSVGADSSAVFITTTPRPREPPGPPGRATLIICAQQVTTIGVVFGRESEGHHPRAAADEARRPKDRGRGRLRLSAGADR